MLAIEIREINNFGVRKLIEKVNEIITIKKKKKRKSVQSIIMYVSLMNI